MTRWSLAMADRQVRWLRVGVAAVWLVTGLAVVFPTYRRVGAEYLDRLGLSPIAMYLACAGEVALAVFLLVWRRPTLWDTLLQAAAVLFFTAVLAALDPMLLVHPYGVLSKNAPLLGCVLAAWLIARERAELGTRVLRVAVAAIWITEGIFPKILFQQPWEREVVSGSHLVPFDPGTFLVLLGCLEALSGTVLLLRVPARLARGVASAQMLALVLLPLLVTLQDPWVWVHPFGPMIKNVPILVGTGVLIQRWSLPSRPYTSSASCSSSGRA